MSTRYGGSRTAAEWVTLALSLLVVMGLIAIALREESDRIDDAGVAVAFDVESATRHGEQYFVPYIVTNTGGDAITSAEIWIEVFAGDRKVESAEVRIQFLPREGKQDGIYVSAFDPATHEARGRLESLQFP